MSHGGISTAVGALVRLLRNESKEVGVISYDNWRPKAFSKAESTVTRKMMFGG